MSLKAILWALENAPVTNPARLVVLIALADRASDDGSAAWPTVTWLAERARCSERSVQRYLRDLQEIDGVLREGDQQLVAHIRRDHRPRVWDLVMDGSLVPAATGRQTVTPPVEQVFDDGVTDGHPVDVHGVTARASRGDSPGIHGVTLLSPEPSFTTFGSETVLEPSRSLARTTSPEQASSSTGTAALGAALAGTAAAEFEAGFMEFYERVYPRREGRKLAREAWVKAVRGIPARKGKPAQAPVTVERLLQAAASYRDDPNRRPAFTALPATWLNQARWDDEPLPRRAEAGTMTDQLAEVIEMGRALDRNPAALGSSRGQERLTTVPAWERPDEQAQALSAAQRLADLERGW